MCIFKTFYLSDVSVIKSAFFEYRLIKMEYNLHLLMKKLNSPMDSALGGTVKKMNTAIKYSIHDIVYSFFLCTSNISNLSDRVQLVSL